LITILSPLQRFLDLLQATEELFLLPCGELVSDAGASTAQELTSDGAVGAFHGAVKHLVGEFLESCLESGELDGGTAAATSQTTLASRLPALVRMVWVVGVAPAGAIDSYPLTPLSSPRDTYAFRQ